MKYKKINTNIIRNNGTIDILSVFRTLFMFLIFLEHYLDAPLKVGGKAVCFFFVLSGFVLSYGYGDKLSNRSLTYKDFSVRKND